LAERLEFVIGAKDQFSGTFGKLTSRLPSIKALSVGAGVAVAGMGAAILKMTKDMAVAGDEARKMSQALGFTTEGLQEFQHAAAIGGVEAGDFQNAMRKLSKTMVDASDGLTTYQRVYDRLNISVKDSTGIMKSNEQILMEVADRFSTMENGVIKTAAATDLFGRSGAKLIPLLNEGSEGMEKLRQEARDLGIVISDDAARNSELFNDTMLRLKSSFVGLRNEIASKTMPIITGLADRLKDFIVDNRDEIVDFGKKFLMVMGNIAEKGAFGVAILVDAWRGLQMSFQIIRIAFNEMQAVLFTGLEILTDKLAGFMEALNFRGIFDSQIAKIKVWRDEFGFGMDESKKQADEAKQKLLELANEGFAVTRVEEFTDSIRNAFAEIAEQGTALKAQVDEDPGYGPFTESNVEATRENVNALNELWNETMTTDLERLNVWYAEQIMLFQDKEESLLKIQQIFDKKRADFQKKDRATILTEGKKFFGNLQTTAEAFGKKGFAFAKAASIAQTTISTFEGAQNTFTALAKFNPIAATIAAGAAIAAGLARVAQITAQQPPAAHGGLTTVPREQTFLLDRGERVVSPRQNEDLTRFLENQEGELTGATIINDVHILENAATAETMLALSVDDWEEIWIDKILPAANRAAAAGVTEVVV
jgi:hypothetical protein